MKRPKTQQEAFWAGQFGSDYAHRNQSQTLQASNLAFFARALRSVQKVESFIEFGANIGLNVRAIQCLFPRAATHAVEINAQALNQLAANLPETRCYHQSIYDFKSDQAFDLVLTKGLLIHLDPNTLESAYHVLLASARRYLLIAEYYSPSPVSVSYRGHEQQLFKRDFAGDLLRLDQSLRLRDYGFVYHRDNNFPQDDITWFLLERIA